jgi:hypothetical protein
VGSTVGEWVKEELPATPGARIGAFVAFGLVAILAAAGALFEMLYYTATPALGPATLGTVVGIIGALIAFFVWGLTAPANE